MASDMSTVASRLPFGNLCHLLEKLDNIRGKRITNPTHARKNHLQKFMESWRSFHQTSHPDGSTSDDSFYPAMRLLLPHLEKERAAYGIKENTLAKLYIDVLDIDKKSTDARRLQDYKAPTVSRMKNVDDFASVAYMVLKSRCPPEGSMSVQDVNDCLDAIAENNNGGDKTVVKSTIMKLLRNLSAVEQKWLIRMIMKDLRCGVSQQTIFNMFHPDAEDLFNVTNSLKQVCVELHDPTSRPDKITLSLFSPFKPMLGDRARPAQIEELMEGREYFIETKYDGERFQIHKNGDEYRYYSRGGNDYSDVYGKDPFSGTLTPFIHNCFLADVRSCILDGEMMGYDPKLDLLGSKGENFDIKSENVFANVGYQPCYVIFDVLHYNDKLLTELSLKERDEYVPRVVRPCKGRVAISERKLASSKEECADALNKAIDNRDEGIMVKRPDSTYKANTRKGGWFKIKPDYVGGLMDELDLLIVGGYFSGGGSMLSHFLLGVAVPSDEEDAKPAAFHSFCRVGSGYTRKELFSLNRRLAAHWKTFKRSSPPSCLVLVNGLKERPDVWIEPDKSIIVQVKASELVYSSSFQTGCTARFPRVEKIRDDKEWYECMTTAELDEIRKKSQNKLTNRYELDEDTGKPKRRKVVSAAKSALAAQFKGVDRGDVQMTSELFMGKSFCIIQGTDNLTKADLEKNVLEFGGEVVQNPDAKITCIVTSKKSGLKVSNFIKSGKYDIVKVEWLIGCIKNQRYIPWSPSDMWFATKMTESKFKSRYDLYGDSYYDPTDLETLEKVFQMMDEKTRVKHITSEEIAELESEYFPDNSPFGLFRICRMYVDDKQTLNNPAANRKSNLDLVALEARFYGAMFSPSLDDRISHVIVEESDLTRLSEIREMARSGAQRFHIVRWQWLRDSMKEGRLLTERHYSPNL